MPPMLTRIFNGLSDKLRYLIPPCLNFREAFIESEQRNGEAFTEG